MIALSVKPDAKAVPTAIKFKRTTSKDLPDIELRDGSAVRSWMYPSSTQEHPIHSMMARLGSFPPALARYFIRGYSKPGDLVLDPFCGKGTTLVEAILAGRSTIGLDVAPDAVLASRAKTSGATVKAIMRAIDSIGRKPTPIVGTDTPDDVAVFYHPDTLSQILVARDWLLPRANSSMGARFVLGCLLGIAHGKSNISLSLPSAHAFAMSPGYVRKYSAEHGLVTPIRNVVDCLRSKAKLCTADDGSPTGIANVYSSSAEKYTFKGHRQLADTVNLIVTSPPYFNAQTYSKDAWLRLWLLGLNHKEVHSRYIETGSVRIYSEKLERCLKEMFRVLKPGGHAFLVAGDATIGSDKTSRRIVQTAQILADIANNIQSSKYKFKVVEIIDDFVVSHSRYLFPVHSNGNSPTAQEPKQERIVHLIKTRVRQKPAATSEKDRSKRSPWV